MKKKRRITRIESLTTVTDALLLLFLFLLVVSPFLSSIGNTSKKMRLGNTCNGVNLEYYYDTTLLMRKRRMIMMVMMTMIGGGSGRIFIPFLLFVFF